MSSSREQGTKAAASVSSAARSSPKRAGMQPATTMAASPASTRGSDAASKMASRLSSVADWMNEQVLTTMTSAAEGSSVKRKPAAARSRPMACESTSFFAQPMVTKHTAGARARTAAVSAEMMGSMKASVLYR